MTPLGSLRSPCPEGKAAAFGTARRAALRPLSALRSQSREGKASP